MVSFWEFQRAAGTFQELIKLSLKLNAQIRDRMVQLGEFGHVSVTFSKM